MENKRMFKDFASVAEAEVLDQNQLDALEAGDSCEAGCKKDCKIGHQNNQKCLNLEVEEVMELK